MHPLVYSCHKVREGKDRGYPTVNRELPAPTLEKSLEFVTGKVEIFSEGTTFIASCLDSRL